MGTKTLGSTAAGDPAHFFFLDDSTGVAFISYHNYHTSTEEMYIDGIYVYCRLHTGGPATLQHALYNTFANPGLLATAGITHTWDTTDQFTHSEFAQGSYYHIAGAGSAIDGAVLRPSSGGLQLGAYNDGLDFRYNSGFTSFPDPFNPTVKVWGSMPWYVTYFPAATVTSVSQTPVAPGQTFIIGGTSFSAGVTGVIIHGAAGDTAVTTYTVDSDTQITATVPTGASLGLVEVDTYAGNATSTQNVQISGGWFKTGGVIQPIKGMWYKTGGVIQPVKGAWFKTGGVINPVK